jgi:proteasome lid subunit RPN8/RPN11
MVLELTSGAHATLLEEAAAAHPRECCGLLLGEGLRISEVRPAANVHPRPDCHFEIDPAALIAAHRAARSGGPQVLGYYHSHPTGLAQPSATDRAMASGDGRIWAIVAGETVLCWRDEPDGFAALPLRVAAG